MIEDKSLLKKYNIVPLGYEKVKKAIIITTKDKKYVLKKREKEFEETYNYLKSRNFHNLPEVYNLNENDLYDIYEYLDNYHLSKEERAHDLILLTSNLHLKTTYYRNVDTDDYKKVYEELDQKIEYLTIYYKELNDLIDNDIYMAPSYYLLARNMTKIHSLLYFCKEQLDEWYNLIKDEKKERVALVHNNLSLDHLLRNEDSFLISWDKAKMNNPIYDMFYFYKNNYKELEFQYLLSLYESKYSYLESERKLLFILISLPDKISFTIDEYENVKLVNDLLFYVYKTDYLISPYYAKEEAK